MTDNYIPIVHSSKDAELVRQHYPDASACRIPLASNLNAREELPEKCKLWIDAGFDGFPQRARLCRKMEERHNKAPNSWYEYCRNLPAFGILADEEITEKDGRNTLSTDHAESLRQTVFEVLDDCLDNSPNLITVPQLAQGSGGNRNCLNRALAELTSEWARKRKFKRLVYPLIFSGLEGQTEGQIWKRKVDTAIDYSRTAAARFFWVVDASLDEEKAAGSLKSTRFPRLISIHEHLRQELRHKTIIGGPYWGFNILLWAKGLIDYPAIAIGSGFRYYLSGGIPRTPLPRAAIPPLRRLAIADRHLDQWFEHALSKLAPSEPEFAELEDSHERLHSVPPETLETLRAREAQEPDAEEINDQLLSAGLSEDRIETLSEQLERLSDESSIRRLSDEWKDQVARFYKRWLDSIAEAPIGGRRIRLYQQLSNAYMLGEVLGGKIVQKSGFASHPSAHAEQLMPFCL